MPRKFWSALAEGTGYSLMGLAVVVCLIWFQPGWVDANFARRWDGSCGGWTNDEVLRHVAGNVLHWWSYVTIAFVIWRLHPPMRTVPYSSVTLFLTGLFVIGCGLGHLSGIMTAFWPAYRLEGSWLLINGVISSVATVFVAFSLTKAFDVVFQRRAKVAEMEQELARLKQK
jgi:hypothetical protein